MSGLEGKLLQWPNQLPLNSSGRLMIWAQNSCRLSLETGKSDQKACCSDEIWPPDGSKQATAFPGKSSQLSIQSQF